MLPLNVLSEGEDVLSDKPPILPSLVETPPEMLSELLHYFLQNPRLFRGRHLSCDYVLSTVFVTFHVQIGECDTFHGINRCSSVP